MLGVFVGKSAAYHLLLCLLVRSVSFALFVMCPVMFACV